MEQKKVVYISAPTVDGKREELARYVDAVNDLGYIALTTSRLPQGLTREQDHKIRSSMIEVADAALFLSEWDEDITPREDMVYCMCTNKPYVTPPTGRDVKPYWLREALEEVTR